VILERMGPKVIQGLLEIWVILEQLVILERMGPKVTLD
jgi:hypothetical protein